MNSLQLWILVGLVFASGVVALVWYFAPAHVDLTDALARLSPAPPVRRPSATPEPTDLSDRFGLWAMRHLPAALWGRTPSRDLAVIGKSAHRLYGEKVLFAGILAAGVPIVASLFALTFEVPAVVPVAAAVVGGVIGWMVPNANLADSARKARLEFNRALGSYVDLVAIERNAGGSGTRGALENAAEIGDTWPFRRLADELARSRFSGEPPWDAMHALAAELGLPALDDLADIMRFAGAEGTQVYDNLRARSSALRQAMLTAEQSHANAVGERMAIPTTLMALVFAAILITPAVLRLAAG